MGIREVPEIEISLIKKLYARGVSIDELADHGKLTPEQVKEILFTGKVGTDKAVREEHAKARSRKNMIEYGLRKKKERTGKGREREQDNGLKKYTEKIMTEDLVNISTKRKTEGMIEGEDKRLHFPEVYYRNGLKYIHTSSSVQAWYDDRKKGQR